MLNNDVDALAKFASRIREGQSSNAGPSGLSSVGPSNTQPHPFLYGNSVSVTATPAVTLYSSAPPSVTHPTSNNPPPPASMNSPQNASSSATNSPQKQHKTIPQPMQGSTPSSAPMSSPSVSSGPTNNTPSLSNATLKRKQGSDAASPTTSNAEQPAPKRTTRKRGRTGGG